MNCKEISVSGNHFLSIIGNELFQKALFPSEKHRIKRHQRTKGMGKVHYHFIQVYPFYGSGYPVYPAAPYYNFPFAYGQDERAAAKDFGGRPFVVDMEKAVKKNQTFRTAIWTGRHLQVTLMSIPVRGEIGLEVHPHTDQFLRIEEGKGLVQMGDAKNQLTFEKRVEEDDAILIPAGKWHNVINTGNRPLKLYSIYAPPQHPFGTVHRTKAEAMAAEYGNRASRLSG